MPGNRKEEVKGGREGGGGYACNIAYVCVCLCVCVFPSTSEAPDMGRCVLLQCVKASVLHAVSRHPE